VSPSTQLFRQKPVVAKKVYLISLEHLDELPADKEEIELARKLNIIFKSGSQLTDVVSDMGQIVQIKGKKLNGLNRGNLFQKMPCKSREQNSALI